MTIVLTAAQRRLMERAAAHRLGVVDEYSGNNGLGAKSRRKMIERLCDAGLMRPYVHGGWEITSEGRKAVSQSAQPAAARWGWVDE